MTTHSLALVPTTPDQLTLSENFDRVAPELAALDPSKLVKANVDVFQALIRIRTALPKLMALRPAITALVPGFDLTRFDKLESYLRALTIAHARFKAAREAHEPLEPLVRRAKQLRTVLLSDARALVVRGLLDQDSPG